ncbi:MAG: hypothetical protein AAF533_14280 [Acidobacteriota bacterium]
MADAEVPRVVGGRTRPEDRSPTDAELSTANEPRGELSRHLRIGTISLVLDGLDERLAGLVDDQYQGFLVDADASENAGRIEVRRSPASAWLHLPRGEGGEEARMEARTDAELLVLWSYFFALRFDREGRVGRLVVCDVDDADLGQAVENVLRFFLSTVALARGGFVLHSSGVLRKGRTFLFFGPSGAGKSTTASHPEEGDCLGDDLVLLERRAEGWQACGVPFRGSFDTSERNVNASGPLAMACRLFQAEENRLETTIAAIALAELMGQVPFLLDDDELRRRAGANLKQLLDEVPVRRLHLKKDPSFWSLLDEAVDAAG